MLNRVEQMTSSQLNRAYVSVRRERIGGMNGQHPFHVNRPDDLPVSAELWDAARKYNGPGLTKAIYHALARLEADLIELRGMSGRGTTPGPK